MTTGRVNSWTAAGLVVLLGSTAGAVADQGRAVASALSDPRRPAAQVRLDAAREPAAIIAFSGLHSGDRIADFMPGNAYFTRLFSDVVGPRGRVVAFIPAEQIAHCPADEWAGSQAVGDDPSYANVMVTIAPLMNFPIEDGLDVIFTAQNYHDLHDAFLGPADVAALNARFFAALRPGGVLIIIDHAAQPGSGLRDTETLHRIDPRQLTREVEAAGFILDAHSDVLRNPRDDHRRSVFDPLIRGRTDQVVLRFRKP